jgi:hypothetical protein
LVVAMVALVVVPPGQAAEKGHGGQHARIPGDCLWDYGCWANDYLVVATAYDPDTRQVTWTLETRKRVTTQRYRARFTDPDLLEMDLRDIQISPIQVEYKKGTRLKATLKLPASHIMQEVNRVTISSAE